MAKRQRAVAIVRASVNENLFIPRLIFIFIFIPVNKKSMLTGMDTELQTWG